MADKKHIFIIGSKGLGNYGGYETFVMKLLENHYNLSDIQYHVACKYNGQGAMDETRLIGAKTIDQFHFEYYGADCFKVKVPEKIGPAQAIVYDFLSFQYCLEYCEKNKIINPIIYILACRIGPFMSYFKKKIKKYNGKIYVNPDGHEWKRSKWSPLVRKYWKESERLMVKYCDLLVCDSINIEKYIHQEYQKYNPSTVYVSYGTDLNKSVLNDSDSNFTEWLKKFSIEKNQYYLIVGRFVPENNFETMISEFMKSKSNRDLVIVTTKNDKLLEELNAKLSFENDPRIKFVGTVYDQEILKKIRENAYAYIHGHSVGGTNPSLLEALSSTKLNLLYDVSFNREVGEDSCLYWDKGNNRLAELIHRVELFEASDILSFDQKSAERVKKQYSWEYIAEKYTILWNN